MIKFKVTKPDNLLKTLARETGLSYSMINKKLREKQVLVNGVRTDDNIDVLAGDEVVIFARGREAESFKTVYEDDDILVVVKPRGVESAEDPSSAEAILAQKHSSITACHRLDRNTEGLLLFAKNKEVEKEITEAFKNGAIEKIYWAFVFGRPKKRAETLTAYLKKNSEKATVMIFDNHIKGSEKIVTEYSVARSNGEVTMLHVNLHTGKTHQIRAHLAYIGCPIAGDGKYGNAELNKKYKLKQQELYAVQLTFKDKTFEYTPVTRF